MTLRIRDSQHKRHSAYKCSAVMLKVLMLSHFIDNYAECHYPECRYAECRSAKNIWLFLTPLVTVSRVQAAAFFIYIYLFPH